MQTKCQIVKLKQISFTRFSVFESRSTMSDVDEWFRANSFLLNNVKNTNYCNVFSMRNMNTVSINMSRLLFWGVYFN